MILHEFIISAIRQLTQAGIDNPQFDARLLACHALKCTRADLLSQSQRILNDEEQKVINTLIIRRTNREPVARIIGAREFWGLEFGLNEATLEPRPDSETIIEAVLSSFRRKPESSFKSSSLAGEAGSNLDSGLRRNDEIKVLDLGTGTGCLLLSLLHEITHAAGVGIDINPRAVEQAMQNAVALGLSHRAKFIVGNWFDEIRGHDLPPDSPAPRGRGVETHSAARKDGCHSTGGGGLLPGEEPTVESCDFKAPTPYPRPRGAGETNDTRGSQKFDIIVSNPPYIPAADIPALMPEVRDFDPILALDGGEDGLAPYRFLIPQLGNFLNPNGIVAFEVGIGQAQQITGLLDQNGFKDIQTHDDLGGITRCVTAKA